MVAPAQRTCFFGNPGMGSWKIRAQQVATARAEWSSSATLVPATIMGHEVFCAIKRPFPARLRLLRSLGKVVLYDVLDCWQQPEDGLACNDMARIRAWFERWFAGLDVDGVIFPDRAMLEDLGDLVPNPVCIYHHYWPGLEPIEVRERARIVGYQGEEHYLGPWRRIVEGLCRRHGLEFVVNPPDLGAIDIGFAARGGEHASLMANRYKSNVKLANFYGAAIPCIVHGAECAYRETDNGQVRFFTDQRELAQRFEELLPAARRREVHESFRAVRPRFSLAAIAGDYERYIEGVTTRRLTPADRAAATRT